MVNFLPPRWRVPAALALVYVAFGGAFVAGKIGIEAVPPFLFAGPRFVIAGLLLLGLAIWREGGRLRLTRRELTEAVLIGLAIIAVGQGSAMWGISQISPSIVAVLVSMMPLWSALLAWAVLGRRITLIAAAGLGIGFVGACFLASPSGSGVRLLPVLVVVGGTVAWAVGALLVSRSGVAGRPLVLGGLQMLTGGVVQLVVALASNEQAHIVWVSLATARLGLAFAFTLVIAAVAGFMTWNWLLRTTPPAIANSVAYGAPVVALLGGWAVLGEPLGQRTLLASAITLAGVALLIWEQGRHRPQVAKLVEEEEEAA